MRKVAIPLAILALIGLDQWVKHWVVANIALNQVIKAIPGLFSLTYLQNRGAAFSILQNQKYFFVILTVLVIGAALVYLVKNYQKSLWLVLSLVLIISGGIGNFIDRQAPLYVELGTGKGDFISKTAALHPEVNFIGIELQQDVLYYAAKKVKELGLTNVRLMVFNIEQIENIFAEDEVDRFYINFCDPWPKARHAKRRLTYVGFLEKYRKLLKDNGELFFKTDNRPLFDFSLEQFELANLKVNALTFDLHNSEYQANNIMTEYERKFSGFGEKINRCEVTFTKQDKK